MTDDRRVRVNGVDLRVRDVGDGPALVFLHGSGADLDMFEPQLRELADRYRCVAFDQRGHGASSGRGDPLGPNILADDAIALCDALGIDQLHAIGVSLGGVVCQALALDHATRLRGVVLGSTVPIGYQAEGVPPQGRFTLTMELAMAQVEAGFSDRFRREQPETLAALIERFWHNDPRTLQAIADGFVPGEITRDLTGFPVPAVVIVGDADLLTPLDRSRELAQVTGGSLVVLEDVGHISNLEAPSPFNHAVVEFVESTMATAG